MYVDTSTTTVTCCNENRLIFRVESAFRDTAKREPDFHLAVHLAHFAVGIQKKRHAHQAACPVCLAAEAIN